jgi:hypothetical protein
MPDTIIYVILIYHIRYISTYLPVARLVLGTMRTTPFGIAEHRGMPSRAPFRICTVPHLAWQRLYHGSGLLAPTTAPHRPIHSAMMLLMQHDHQHFAPPLIQEGCGRHVITHRALIATSSHQRRQAGQQVAMGWNSQGR